MARRERESKEATEREREVTCTCSDKEANTRTRTVRVPARRQTRACSTVKTQAIKRAAFRQVRVVASAVPSVRVETPQSNLALDVSYVWERTQRD